MIKSGLIWDFFGKVFNQGVSFIVSIFLARLLFPEDFALIAMVMAFYGLARIFIDFGFSAAIVQQLNVSQIQLSTVFWFSATIGLTLSVLCFFSARQVANFYEQEQIFQIARVMSFIIILSALGGVHSAILQKKLEFKKLASIGVFSGLISGAIGVCMAFKGYGVWSLVVQYYISGIIRLFLLWNATKWIPSPRYSWVESKSLFLFGKNVFLSQLIYTFYTQLDVFVIGKLFMPATLGFYSRAKGLNQLISQHSSGSLNTVLFPAISKIQQDKVAVRELVMKFFHLSAFLSFFLGGLLYLIAEDVIVILFTDRWLSSVPYFKIMVLSTFTYPVSAIILNPINSLGRSDIFLKLEIIKKVLITVVYVVGFEFGILQFLYGMLVYACVALIINCYVSGKLINWPLKSQLGILLSYGVPVYIITYIAELILSNFFMSHFFHLLISSPLFVIIVIIYSFITKLKGFNILKTIIYQYCNLKGFIR